MSSTTLDCRTAPRPAAQGTQGAQREQRAAALADFLSPPTIGDASANWTFLQRRSAVDSTERGVAGLRMEERHLSSDADRVTLVSNWLAPVNFLDTLVVDRGTLMPLDEVSVSPQMRFQYQYRYDAQRRATRVTGSIQRGDSTPRQIDRSYGEPVFAFNELEQLVRSLRYRAGTSVVVPLFSEVDTDLEHDTLTVVRDTVVRGAQAWIVRFADPVIVKRYLIDPAARAVLETETRQRKTGITFRLVPAQSP